MDRFDLDGTTRVSIAPYNDNTDIDALLTGVRARGEHAAMSDQLYQDAHRGARQGQDRRRQARQRRPRSARRDNPLCGDRVTIDVRLDGRGQIAEIAHQVRGCLLCQASASALASIAVGRDAAGIADLAPRRRTRRRPRSRRGAASRSRPSRRSTAHKSRQECVLLPFEALKDALS